MIRACVDGPNPTTAQTAQQYAVGGFRSAAEIGNR